jgi:hypothetical protein
VALWASGLPLITFPPNRHLGTAADASALGLPWARCTGSFSANLLLVAPLPFFVLSLVVLTFFGWSYVCGSLTLKTCSNHLFFPAERHIRNARSMRIHSTIEAADLPPGSSARDERSQTTMATQNGTIQAEHRQMVRVYRGFDAPIISPPSACVGTPSSTNREDSG